MSRFNPPYPYTFDDVTPTPSNSTGNPVSHAFPSGTYQPRIGDRNFNITSDPSQPSTFHVISSFGVDGGVPTDESGRPYIGRSILSIGAFFHFDSMFNTGGTFASAFTTGFVKFYVEEFRGGSFVRAMSGVPQIILRENPSYFSGNNTWTPNGNMPITSGESFVANPGLFYRVWIDVEGEIRAAGGDGGRFGSSVAAAALSVRILYVNTFFYLRPGL